MQSPTTEPQNGVPTSSVLSAPREGETVPLSLNEAFNPSSGWHEDRYDIASAMEVRGISQKNMACWNERPELEFRLANHYSELSFSFGQANDSLSADLNLKVAVYGDEKQLDVNSVPFNQTRNMTVPVTGVNSLKIIISANDEKCEGLQQSLTPVLYNLTIK